MTRFTYDRIGVAVGCISTTIVFQGNTCLTEYGAGALRAPGITWRCYVVIFGKSYSAAALARWRLPISTIIVPGLIHDVGVTTAISTWYRVSSAPNSSGRLRES